MFSVHHLKTWPEPFQQLWNGTKRFEIRVFDRDYKTGDMVRLFEYDPKAETFTGRYIRGDIGHIEKPGSWGLPETIGVFAVQAFECRCISPDRATRWYGSSQGEGSAP